MLLIWGVLEDQGMKLDRAELIVARSHPKARVLLPFSTWLGGDLAETLTEQLK